MRALDSVPAILTEQELRSIGDLILSNSKSDVTRVQVKNISKVVSRIANNRVLSSDNGSGLEISVVVSNGARVPVTMTTNYTDERVIRAAIKLIDDLAKVQLGSPNNYLSVPDGPQEYVPVSLWSEPTISAMSTVADTVVPKLIAALRPTGLNGSGFVGLIARSTLVLQRDGLAAYCRETDSECTVSVRTSDGKASGWWGQAARDWSTINAEFVSSNAIDMARRNMNPYAVEPGRRTAILSPFATSQILRFVSRHFDAYATNVLHGTAFSVQHDPEQDNKLGQRVLDRRIRIISDPSDPAGGYTPFGDLISDGIALPTAKKMYIDNGILRDLAYDVSYGMSEGKAFTQNPWSMRFEAHEGAGLHTIDEMISNCKEGIYVHRLSDVNQLDGITGIQTGVTRDGCFLIKNGKIDRPVKNLRYTDSPFYFLNRIVSIGKPERVAMGYMPQAGEPIYASDWPRRPMIVPPVMVTDFNFTALSDAI